jgi:hypothetical protein
MKARDYPHDVVEIECGHCGRYGKYSKARFCELVGAGSELPQALAIIAASCPEDRPSVANMHGKCQPHYRRLVYSR